MDQANITLLPGPMHPPNVGNARRGRNTRHGALHGNQSERLSLGEEAKLVGLIEVMTNFFLHKKLLLFTLWNFKTKRFHNLKNLDLGHFFYIRILIILWISLLNKIKKWLKILTVKCTWTFKLFITYSFYVLFYITRFKNTINYT